MKFESHDKLLPRFVCRRFFMEQHCNSARPRSHSRIGALSRFPIAAIAVCGLSIFGLSLVSGCTRTSDGSVVLARQFTPGAAPSPSYASAAMQQQEQAASAEPAMEAPARPAARRPSSASVGKVQAWKPAVVRPPFTRSDPENPITCNNATSAGGRVRVVCQ